MSDNNKFSLISNKFLDSNIDVYFLKKLRGTDEFERIPFRISKSEKENIANIRMRIEKHSNLW